MPKIVKDEEIYQAVIQIVAERGYSSATTKQMADAADVSEMTLFRKYENKAQLVKQAISSILDQTDFSTAAHYTGDIQDDLLRVVNAYQNSAVKHGDFVSAMILEMSRHPELIDSINEPLKIFMAIGELKKGHSMHIVAVLLAPIMYTAIIRRAVPTMQLPEIDLTQHVKHFLIGNQQVPLRS